MHRRIMGESSDCSAETSACLNDPPIILTLAQSRTLRHREYRHVPAGALALVRIFLASLMAPYLAQCIGQGARYKPVAGGRGMNYVEK